LSGGRRGDEPREPMDYVAWGLSADHGTVRGVASSRALAAVSAVAARRFCGTPRRALALGAAQLLLPLASLGLMLAFARALGATRLPPDAAPLEGDESTPRASGHVPLRTLLVLPLLLRYARGRVDGGATA
jgi:hypothetical protein